MAKYTFDLELTNGQKQNLHKIIGSLYTSFSTLGNEVCVETSRDLTPEEITTLEMNLVNAPEFVSFDANDFDEWLMTNYMGTELEQYFPVLSRATEKNNARGYQQMIAFAQAKNISQEVQNALISKLTELGANIQ